MSETANPTVEELADYDELVNGDVSAAQDELVRRILLNLPTEIARKNAEKGWTGPDAIVAPEDVRLAPRILTDDFINMVLVGVDVSTTPQGIGGIFRNELRVAIYSVDARIETDQQVRIAWGRAEAIRAVLYHFLSGCRDANDQQCWRMLEPTGYGMLPGDWSQQYSGTETTYRMIQSHN